ncbi:MAG: diacylglycerol kinase family lipid kinase [Clostridiales bacterium]|nr:diacylglycerol kinase family lipid kinase [Clostridiales bacterium]
MALRLKIIMNPSSGRETARVNIEDMLAYLVSFSALERADIYYTTKRFDAVKFAASTDPSEYDYLIAVGGDGTVNEVVTGLMEGKVDIPLAIYTSGTVNDFATINDLPSRPSDFARMLISPDLVKVDCGKVNGKYFLNVLAGGLMTDVAYKVPSDLKTAFGPAAYWISAMKDLPAMNQTVSLKIIAGDEVYEEDAIMFLISNSKSVGGFRKLMTMADLTDGLLDVLVVKKMEPGEIVPLLGKLMIGDHINSSNVLYLQTKELELHSDGDVPVVLDIDGEEGPHLPARVRCIHEAITLVVPGKEESL